MRRASEKKYDVLSPFELKNELIKLAKTRSEKLMLNAGRGNPNWLAVTPREAFFLLGEFALSEAKRTFVAKPEFAQSPTSEGIVKRFSTFLNKHKRSEGAKFLKKIVSYVEKELHIGRSVFLFEMVDAILGDHYPMPDRMLACAEKIVRHYLIREMCGNHCGFEKLDLFATEGLRFQ
jgi:aspartate 4-decarboxylase